MTDFTRPNSKKKQAKKNYKEKPKEIDEIEKKKEIAKALEEAIRSPERRSVTLM